MSWNSKRRKQNRLKPKVEAFYYKYNKWLSSEPRIRWSAEYNQWKKAEPVKPKWLVEYEKESQNV